MSLAYVVILKLFTQKTRCVSRKLVLYFLFFCCFLLNQNVHTQSLPSITLSLNFHVYFTDCFSWHHRLTATPPVKALSITRQCPCPPAQVVLRPSQDALVACTNPSLPPARLPPVCMPLSPVPLTCVQQQIKCVTVCVWWWNEVSLSQAYVFVSALGSSKMGRHK